MISPIIKNVLICSVAILHLGFLILEMFLWTKPIGLKIFRMSQDQASATAILAANQGLYNGFLAAGLVWSLFNNDVHMSHQLSVFFLVCVIVAALYGGYSVNQRILIIQGLPAALALVATLCLINF